MTVTASSTATAPATATAVATAVTASTATLAGTVNPNGADTHTWFLWGTSSSLSGATQTATQDLGATAGNQAVSASISGLAPSTTYYYQAVAQNSLGTTSGAIFSFATDPAPYFQMVTGAPLERCARRDDRKYINSFSNAVVWIHRSSESELRDHANGCERSAHMQRAGDP